MVKYRFRPEKKFGQNFIINENLVSKIIEAADLRPEDIVLEIGCGSGFLTKELLDKKVRVIGFELDENLTPLLEEKFRNNKNFELIKEDFLSAKLPKFNKVVSLPPYNISTQIITKLFAEKIERAVLVFQKEFAEKLTAQPGYPEYNYLSVITNLKFTSKILVRNISPVSFYPKPESFSSLLLLSAKDVKIKNIEKFIFFLKHLFRYKNKNLSNSLMNCIMQTQKELGVDSKSAIKVLELSGIKNEKVTLLEPELFLGLFIRLSQ